MKLKLGAKNVENSSINNTISSRNNRYRIESVIEGEDGALKNADSYEIMNPGNSYNVCVESNTVHDNEVQQAITNDDVCVAADTVNIVDHEGYEPMDTHEMENTGRSPEYEFMEHIEEKDVDVDVIYETVN